VQRVEWTADGWLRLADGGHWPQDSFAVARAGVGEDSEDVAPDHPGRPERDEFGGDTLSDGWCSLREPATDRWLSLTQRPGRLRLTGRKSLRSRYDQSLIAQRLTSVHTTVTTRVEFAPTHPGQRAGLVCWYDTGNHYYLSVAGSEDGPRLVLSSTIEGVYTEHQATFPVSDWPEVHLRARLDGAALRFAASPDAGHWREIGPVLDAGVLSDDYGSLLRFTGAFVGLAAQDPMTASRTADFAYFDHHRH
jgi:xylan 1,4-beta-xylosidase